MLPTFKIKKLEGHLIRSGNRVYCNIIRNYIYDIRENKKKIYQTENWKDKIDR